MIHIIVFRRTSKRSDSGTRICILELVELDELGVFSMIHLVDIVEEVDLSTWSRPLNAESRACFEPELHSEYPTPSYLFFESELYRGDSDNHWLQ